MTGDSGYALAPLGRRCAAWLFDAGIGAVLAACFVKVAGGESDLRTVWHLLAFKSVNGQAGHQLASAMNPTTANVSALGPIAGLLAILTVIAVVGVAYRVVSTAMWGAGFGKYLLGLRVVLDSPTADSTEVPGWGRSWKRWVVPQVPGLIPLPATGLLAYLPALRDARRRGLHDRAAGTIVVNVRSPLATPEHPSWRLASADGYFDPLMPAKDESLAGS
jgi:uncharacterized RDD family membrane protein YckC